MYYIYINTDIHVGACGFAKLCMEAVWPADSYSAQEVAVWSAVVRCVFLQGASD
jgi:hypothetical protein